MACLADHCATEANYSNYTVTKAYHPITLYNMMGKVISGLRPNAYDLLEEATLNAALATIASLRPESEIDALMCVQAVIAGFSALRMLELSQRHLGEENIAVYGGYANKLIKLQNDLLQTLDRRRRGNSQSIVVKHVHIHPGAQGVVGIVNHDEGQNRLDLPGEHQALPDTTEYIRRDKINETLKICSLRPARHARRSPAQFSVPA